MFTGAAISHNERFCKGASPNFVKPQVIKVIGIEKQTSLKISLLRKKKSLLKSWHIKTNASENDHLLKSFTHQNH